MNLFEEMMMRFAELEPFSQERIRAIVRSTFDDSISREDHQKLVCAYAVQATATLNKDFLKLECDFAETFLSVDVCVGYLHREFFGAGEKSS